MHEEEILLELEKKWKIEIETRQKNFIRSGSLKSSSDTRKMSASSSTNSHRSVLKNPKPRPPSSKPKDDPDKTFLTGISKQRLHEIDNDIMTNLHYIPEESECNSVF